MKKHYLSILLGIMTLFMMAMIPGASAGADYAVESLIAATEADEAEFESFKALCEAPNYPNYYDGLRGRGNFTVLSSMTIPAGMQVDADGTTFVIPDGVTLTVRGRLDCSSLTIAETGLLRAEDNTGAQLRCEGFQVAGTIYLGNGSYLATNRGAWNANLAEKFRFGGDNAVIYINTFAYNEQMFNSCVNILRGIEVTENTRGHIVKIQNIYFPWALTDSSVILENTEYQVRNDGENMNGSVNIPEGANITLNPRSMIVAYGTDITVEGALQNKGYIVLRRGAGSNSTLGRLVITDSGSYSGGGCIQVLNAADPKGQIVGIDRTKIMTSYENAGSGWSQYRVAPTDWAEYLNGLAGTEEYVYLDEPLTIHRGETMTVPARVSLVLNQPLTVENGGTLVNASDIYIENGSLTIEDGGTLILQDRPDEDWLASVSLCGGTMDASEGSIIYDDDSEIIFNSWYYDTVESLETAVRGVPDNRIGVRVTVSTAQELFGMEGNQGYWNTMRPYGWVEFYLENRLNLLLMTDEIPERYYLVADRNTSIKIPEEHTLTVNGGIILEGGLLDNSGILDVNGQIIFRRSESGFVNSGLLNVFGKIRTSTYYEENPTGTIHNYGGIYVPVADGGAIEEQIRVIECLTTFVLPASLTEVREEAFAGTTVQQIELPESIEELGKRAFADSESLSVVFIATASVQIAPDAFENSDHVRIFAPAGGTVEQYAHQNGIPFLALG